MLQIPFAVVPVFALRAIEAIWEGVPLTVVVHVPPIVASVSAAVSQVTEEKQL